MERSQATRDRGRSRKTIKKIIQKDLEINNIMTKVDSCSRLYLWDKAWLLYNSEQTKLITLKLVGLICCISEKLLKAWINDIG